MKNICSCGILAIFIFAFGCASTKSGSLESMRKEFGPPQQIFTKEGNIYCYWADVDMLQIKNRFREPEVVITNEKFNIYIFDNRVVFSDSNETKGVLYIIPLK